MPRRASVNEGSSGNRTGKKGSPDADGSAAAEAEEEGPGDALAAPATGIEALVAEAAKAAEALGAAVVDVLVGREQAARRRAK